MGTVIIYEGLAYIFRDMAPNKAVKSFLFEWFHEPITGGFMVYQISGEYLGDGGISETGSPWYTMKNRT